MGSFVEFNDTLQLTSAQGFPVELVLEKHGENPYRAEDFADKVFAFRDKESVRIFHAPPVRTFLVENRDDKWIYWGLCEVLHVEHDLVAKMTSGKFRITYIYTPEEMCAAHGMIDRREGKEYKLKV